MRWIALVVMGSLGCVSSYQSARVLSPGKTQVTAAVTRIQVIEENSEDDSVYAGEIAVRHGVADQLDVGVRLARTPGAGDTGSALFIDPKYQITSSTASTTVSIGLPLGVGWVNDGGDSSDKVGIIAPTLLIGAELTPTTELVFAPKMVLFVPEGDASNEVEFGTSLGVRFTNPARTWAIHPELSLLLFKDSGGGENRDFVKIVSFGIAISAGN